MDSLLATYASSDEEDDRQPPPPPPQQPKRTALFSSLPKPQSSSSVFQSLPQPKKALAKPSILDDDDDEEDLIASKPTSKPSSSVFSALPPPKSKAPTQPIANFSPADQNPRRVVKITPPINPYLINPSQFDDDDDDEEEEAQRRRKKESESSAQASSKLSLPAPKHSATLGSGSGSGLGRRAIVDTESVGSGMEIDPGVGQNVGVDQNGGNYKSFSGYESGIDPNAADYGSYESYQYGGADGNVEGGVQLQTGTSGNDGVDYGGYEQYGNGVNGSATAANAGTGLSGIFSRKRGRNEVPTEIVEVKQDELMKNRPREDQVKATGIAFGPSYQPASTKGKPSKLLRRKHQIGSLYFDMKQKEMELSERRSRGFLTKAETQAKYGW